MPGFFSVIDYSSSKETLNDKNFKAQMSYKSENFSAAIYSDTIDKFKEDKIFYQDNELIIVLEGVVFNKKILISQSKSKSWIETVKQLYKKNGNVFHIDFRGSYSGFIYDKQKKEWNVFTNPIGDKQVFVFKNKDTILFGSEIKHFLSFFKLNSLSVSLDETAAYMLLSYGFFIEDYTLFNEIKKLKAGHYLSIHNKKTEIASYHQFSNKPDTSLKNEKDIVEEVDQRFRTAIKREFDKDQECGYKHLAGLSGGLDSRMTVWVAHEMGYTNQLNFTFSQTNYLDETIAKSIATDLRHEWIFKALDNGTFLIDQLESVIDISYGGALYYGLAHGKSLYDLLDMSVFGTMHTGQLGDVVIGSFYKKPSEISTPINIQGGSYSAKMINKIKPVSEAIAERYPNNEIFKFYTRGFTGANQGLLVSQQQTETFSPFYDLDFFEFCLSIPAEKRIGHYMYKKWIKEKYPKAAEYIWEKIGAKISAPTIKVNGIEFTTSQLQRIIKYKLLKPFLGNKASRKATKHNMNPLDYWYNSNYALKSYMDDYYRRGIVLFDAYPELKNDMTILYETGSTVEKNQVLTLVAATKRFMG